MAEIGRLGPLPGDRLGFINPGEFISYKYAGADKIYFKY